MQAASCIVSIQSVWPEPYSSAAGVRSVQLLRGLLQTGARVICASAAQNWEARDRMMAGIPGIECVSISMNDSDFDQWIGALQPSGVIFDRYVTEEQFGARVFNSAPKAARMIDTQDLHFLRAARLAALQNNLPLPGRNPAEYQDPTTFRELAAILRSDQTWVVSAWEKDWLVETWGIPPHKVQWIPFASELSPERTLPNWEARSDIVFVGNYRHAPNLDAIRWLKGELWPQVRARNPGLRLRCGGAYPPAEVSQMHSPETGFLVEGPIKDLGDWMAGARVLVAPLRCGAGIKGKILDAWASGTPVVTTAIGAEGFWKSSESGGDSWPGQVTFSSEALTKAVVEIESDSTSWDECSRRALGVSRSLFARATIQERVADSCVQTSRELSERRPQDWLASVLWQSSLRSTEYFSRWIEAKNRLIITD